EDAMPTDLHDGKDARPREPRGQPGLLYGEAVDRPLGGQGRPLERVAAALGTEAAPRPRGAPAPGAGRRAQRARPQPRVELVQLRELRRLQRERIDGAEVAHGITGHLLSIGTPARRTCSRLSRSTRA